MMNLNSKQSATLEASQRYFNDGLYDRATPLLNSLVSQKVLSPDVYHMLGTINYEQGQFKASIVSFKKALYLDPFFTDSSIGLSVVLNDLGKYEQAKQIFQDAQKRLKETSHNNKNAGLDLEIAKKHKELCALYTKAGQPQAAFQNLSKYEDLAGENLETTLEKANLQRALSNFNFGAEILKSWQSKNPELKDTKFFATLSELFYLDRKVLLALSACEQGLKFDPKNKELINLFNNLTNTEFDLRQAEI